MNKALLEQLLELSPAERIELAHELWDSILPADHTPQSAAQKQEIDRRIAEHERDPSRASSWDEVQARLQARFG
jgi:putative addiction module component (TIGR02574 family)